MSYLRPKGVLVGPGCHDVISTQGLVGPAYERRESGNMLVALVVERVIQEDPTGCGLACVSMVVSASYAEVRKLAIEHLGFDSVGPFYTDLDDLRYMLDWYGYGLLRWTPFKSYKPISPVSIMGIERNGSGVEDHWVVHVKCGLDRYVFDPSRTVKTVQRRDWWKLRPVSYANIIKL
ncbi:MAG: hypothetical protein JEY79_12820 [Pseudodesulfovibrio sp.]|nr:hypothetical protein [Pseudodesulfovibrio sp.]